MIYVKSKFLNSVLILLLFVACTEEKKEEHPEVNWTKEQSTSLGKNLAIQEEIDIKLFLEMHKDWKMTKTGSGLQYYIYEHGEGDSVVPGNVVNIEYEVGLLDGTICYKTEENEYEEMMVDRSEIESGVQEGIKLMRIGDKAKLIIPSHIGHGLLGDRDKIPPLTPLLIDLSVTGKVI